MSSRLTSTPDEASAFLQAMMAASRTVQVAFVSTRSGTHIFMRGTVEQTPDEIGFLVSDGSRCRITVNPTLASACRRVDSEAAQRDPMAERFFPTLEFTEGLVLEFNRVEKLVIFAISSDRAH
jgi:hypothetical protein